MKTPSVSPRFAGPRARHADLSRIQIIPDLRAIRLVEGIRGALACALVIVLGEWLNDPALIYVALAAFFTCLSDTGGPIRRRLPRLVTFTVCGALLWGGLGALREWDWTAALVVGLAAIFCAALARVWGPAAGAVGNFLAIIVILSLDQPLAPAEALRIGLLFLVGGAWASVLAIALWWLYPNRPTRNAVVTVWRELQALVADLLALTRRDDVEPAEWEAHAHKYRRPVREAIENARVTAIDTVGLRGNISATGSRALLQLEAGEQLFGTLIALSAILEHGGDGARRDAEHLLRVIRPTLAVMIRGMSAQGPLRLTRFENAINAAASRAKANPALARIVDSLVAPLRVVAQLVPHDPDVPDRFGLREPPPDRLAQMIGILRANLTWRSAVFRHAVRAVVVVMPALAVSSLWHNPFAHWLPITAVVTLQPFYGATWQRALERVGGTLVGGLLGGGLALLAHTPLALAALMVPLSLIAFSSRQVSFGLFIACVTPLIVVLMELVHPDQSSWEIAGLRALFTILGGAVAVLGWLVLWPSWEPDRLGGEIRKGLLGLETYATAVLSERLGERTPAETDAARRVVGLATNNLEASLARAFQEPGHGDNAQIEAAMVVDSALRRMAGLLSAMRHDDALRATVPAEEWRGWRTWMARKLQGLASGSPAQIGSPETQANALLRMARQVELIDNALARTQKPG